MRLLVSAKMGHGTFQAKFVPLSKVARIESIHVLRKSSGPLIEKVKYAILPRITRYPLFNLVITPLQLVRFAWKIKPRYLISYHFLPHAIFVWIASKMTGIPFIFCQTGGYVESYATGILKGRIVKRILKSAYHINVPGKESVRFWVELGINSRKISVLHSTIDTDKILPNSDNMYYKYDFVFVGRLDAVKRIDWIINAISNIKSSGRSYRLAIVGDGPLRNELKRLVEKLGMTATIEFLGFQENVFQFLDVSKVMVMASKSEGLPVALMEAMASEKLVIAPSVNNIPSVVADGITGFLFNPMKFGELQDAMLNAIENYEAYTTMRKNARKVIVENYSYAVAERKWNEILFKEKSKSPQ